jgi:hypothetical protein
MVFVLVRNCFKYLQLPMTRPRTDHLLTKQYALRSTGLAVTYFAVAPAPVSQSSALAAPLATQAAPLWETDTLTLVDRGRPSNEDIVKAFRLATEDRERVVAQAAIFDTAIPRPVPLPKRRPPPPHPDL